MIGARLVGGELTRVSAWCGLRHGDLLFAALRRDDRQLGIGLIDKRARRIDRVERDRGFAILLRDLYKDALGVAFAHRIADDLRPELAKAGPIDPFGSPTALGVGGEGDR